MHSSRLLFEVVDIVHIYISSRLLGLPPLVARSVTDQQELREEVLCEIVKWFVSCSKLVRRGDSRDTGDLMHILYLGLT